LERIIGRYEGTDEGPLLICFGSIHGNEPAGTKALELMFKMLEVEPITNPSFNFKGRLLGLRGNLRAIQAGKRYLKKDLNRQWTVENVNRIMQAELMELEAEDLEIRELKELINQEIAAYQPAKIVLLDLHTTTNIGIPTTAVCFESGQHDEQLSINRAIAAITNCMRTIGCVRAEDVENQHDKLLMEFSKGLPKVSQLIMTHAIEESDKFVMRAGYKNFHTVKEGEKVADDQKGSIKIVKDGLLLMPLYQKQGDDGFFLIESVDEEFGF